MKPTEVVPPGEEWLLLHIKASGKYDLLLAEALCNRLYQRSLISISDGISAVAQAENMAMRAGLSIVYVLRK